MSDEPFNGPRGNSESLLDVAAANGKYYRLVAADDSHPYRGEQCVSWVMVQATQLTVSAILEALRAGRFYATQGPAFHSISIEDGLITVESSPVSRITFRSNLYWVGDRCRSGQELTREVYRIHPNERFVRIQITDSDGKRRGARRSCCDKGTVAMNMPSRISERSKPKPADRLTLSAGLL